MTLDVPIFAQEHSWTCVPACIRMILAYQGDVRNEHEIAEACATRAPVGTLPEKAVDGVAKLGYRALWFENADFERLESLISHGWPVIVFVRAEDLPHGRRGLHSAVVVGITDRVVVMADPALGRSFEMNVADFERAWRVLNAQGMVVWKEEL